MIRYFIFIFLQISITESRIYDYSNPIGKEQRYNFVDEINRCGYNAETLKIETEDQINLILFRIKPQGEKNDLKPFPILLLHGLLTDANFFLIPECEDSLPIILSKQGYDVWVGNVRGTFYSGIGEQETVKDPTEFWEFSVDDLAIFDIPAMIDSILKKTNKPKLIYVGHSQGCMVLFAAISYDQKLNEKIEKFIALGPATKLEHTNGLAVGVTHFKDSIKGCKHDVMSCENLPDSIRSIPTMASTYGSYSYYFTIFGLFNFIGFNFQDMDEKLLKKILFNAYSPVSCKNVLYFIQLMETKVFSMFDYGESKNLELFGTSSPPLYNISRTSVPVYIFSGSVDALTAPKDVLWVHKQLKNSQLIKIPYGNHLDYVTGKIIGKKVSKTIQNILDGLPFELTI